MSITRRVKIASLGRVVETIILLTAFSLLVKAGFLRWLDSYLYSFLYIGNASIISLFSETGSIYAFAILVIALLIADLARYRQITLFTAGLTLLLILNSALVSILKISLQIPRPLPSSYNYTKPLELLEIFGYPSGHTARAFALASYFSTTPRKHNKKLAATLYAWAAAVALSRLVLGVHWFSDVIGGLLVGILTTQLTSISLPYVVKALPKKMARAIAMRFPDNKNFPQINLQAWLHNLHIITYKNLYTRAIDSKPYK